LEEHQKTIEEPLQFQCYLWLWKCFMFSVCNLQSSEYCILQLFFIVGVLAAFCTRWRQAGRCFPVLLSRTSSSWSFTHSVLRPSPCGPASLPTSHLSRSSRLSTGHSLFSPVFPGALGA